MRIGIIGAGALGGLYGARLFRAGYNVHFLLHTDYDAVLANGLQVRSWQGDFRIKPPIHGQARDLGPCDLLIIGLKATQNHLLPELLIPTVHSTTAVLTLQNGLGNEEAIQEALNVKFHDRTIAARAIIGGVAFLCSTRPEPGVIEHTDHGRVRLAEFVGGRRARTEEIAAMFRKAEFPADVDDSLAQVRWEKLVWNIPFNGLGVAAHHADTAAIMLDQRLFDTVVALMKEVIAAANANGARIDEASYIERMIDSTRPIGHYRTSMQLDWEAGKHVEVEAILGEPLRRAERAGVPTPLLRMLYGIVRRMDAFPDIE